MQIPGEEEDRNGHSSWQTISFKLSDLADVGARQERQNPGSHYDMIFRQPLQRSTLGGLKGVQLAPQCMRFVKFGYLVAKLLKLPEVWKSVFSK